MSSKKNGIIFAFVLRSATPSGPAFHVEAMGARRQTRGQSVTDETGIIRDIDSGQSASSQRPFINVGFGTTVGAVREDDIGDNEAR